MSETKQSSGGIGFIGLLQIVFITLKLTGFISWSWWLVLIPFLGYAMFLLVVGVVALVFVLRGWR